MANTVCSRLETLEKVLVPWSVCVRFFVFFCTGMSIIDGTPGPDLSRKSGGY